MVRILKDSILMPDCLKPFTRSFLETSHCILFKMNFFQYIINIRGQYSFYPRKRKRRCCSTVYARVIKTVSKASLTAQFVQTEEYISKDSLTQSWMVLQKPVVSC